MGLLDFDVVAVVAATVPNVSPRNGAKVWLEQGAQPPGLAGALTAMGHEVAGKGMTSGLDIIRVQPDGTLQGGADPRREGFALGD